VSGIEYANGQRVNTAARSGGLFPRAWGTPPLDRIERIAWIARHTRGRPLLPATEIREHTPPRRRTTDPRLARLDLLAKERPPYE
jgi:hypothetical protein